MTLTHGNLLHNAIALRHASPWTPRATSSCRYCLPTMGLVAGVVLPPSLAAPSPDCARRGPGPAPPLARDALLVVGATHTRPRPPLLPPRHPQALGGRGPARPRSPAGGLALRRPRPPRHPRPVRRRRWPHGFDRAAFRPGYTLGEATAAVAWSDRPVSLTLRATALAADRVEPAAEGDARSLTSAGRPVVDQEIVVVRPGTDEALPAGAIGELLVRGPSIAAGYWNRRRETARRFGAGVATRGDLPFVRTGDLGFLHEGQLYVTGRVKALLIVEGRPLHPRDVEATIARARASTRPGGASAFTLEGEGGEQLVIVAELQNPDLPASRLDDEAQALVDAVHHAHGVRPWALAFVAPGHLPRVAPGRVDRAATRGRWAAHTLEIIHEWRAGGPITASRRLTPPPLVGRWTPGVDDPEAARAALRALFLERSGLGEDACIGGAEAIDLFPPLPGEPVDAWASLEQLSLAGRRTDPPAARQAARRRVFESLRARLDVGRPLLLQAHAWRHADREQRPAHWLQAFHRGRPRPSPPTCSSPPSPTALRWIADAREDPAAALAAWSPPAIAAEALAHARAQVEARPRCCGPCSRRFDGRVDHPRKTGALSRLPTRPAGATVDPIALAISPSPSRCARLTQASRHRVASESAWVVARAATTSASARAARAPTRRARTSPRPSPGCAPCPPCATSPIWTPCLARCPPRLCVECALLDLQAREAGA
ncbi:MAG: AMP-binding protein [bacterium]